MVLSKTCKRIVLTKKINTLKISSVFGQYKALLQKKTNDDVKATNRN